MLDVVETVGEATVVLVTVEFLDASNSQAFKAKVGQLVVKAVKLVLDLHRVQLVDSRGCGVILSCLKHISPAGGDMKLCRITEPVRMVFDLIRMHSICEIVNTREEAVQAFQNSKQP